MLQDWTTRYGGLFSFRLGSKLFVVISDHQIACDILVDKAQCTSSRLELLITSEALWASLGVINTTDNQVWRTHRRIMQQLLSSKAVAEYVPIIQDQADRLLLDLASSGRSLKEIQDVLDIYVAELALNLLLGTHSCHRDEAISLLPLIKQVERSMRHLEYHITEVVPYVWIPWSCAKTNAQCLQTQMIESFGKILRQADPRGVRLLSLSEREGLDETEVALLAAAFVIGAHVSTVPILHSCIKAFSTHPDIRHRARFDVDTVIGELARPEADDERWLPYTSAIIDEALRCQPPFVHMPHVVSESFVYRGMNIPKGAGIILNAWPINNDARQFTDPSEFEPSRYSTAYPENLQNHDIRDRHFWAFGSGHRICSAILLSNRVLWLTLARMIWAFNIEQVSDQTQRHAGDRIEFKFRFSSETRRSICCSSADQDHTSRKDSDSTKSSSPGNERWVMQKDDLQPHDSHAVIRRT